MSLNFSCSCVVIFVEKVKANKPICDILWLSVIPVDPSRTFFRSVLVMEGFTEVFHAGYVAIWFHYSSVLPQ